MTVPSAADQRLIRLWEAHRTERPILRLYCGSCRGRGKRLAEVWVTKEALLLHYRSHVAPQKLEVTLAEGVSTVQLHRHLQEKSDLRYDWTRGVAMIRGWRDIDGRLVMLDGDAWKRAVVACYNRLGDIVLDREHLIDKAVEAERHDRTITLRLTTGR